MKKIIANSFFGALSLTAGVAMAQQPGSIISGQVVDAIEPLMMVNVVEIDASNRIVSAGQTDINGNFSFAIKNPKNRLRISYVGYKEKIIPIKGTHYKIVLQDNTTMAEVKIVAKKKTQTSGLAIPEREVSAAAQRIDAKEFEGLAVTTVDEALQGRISGLDIVANSGNLGSGMSMRLRGVSTINGSSEPLIVVDGNVLQMTEENFDFSNANEEKFAQLLNVNPEDIESISVLKDAAATAIWGSQGSNGVIEIKTKRGKRGPTQVSYSYNFRATYQPDGFKMLNGDEYTMLMKEEYFNPKLSADAANIREFNYDPSFSEYWQYADNTDWVDKIKQVGSQHKHFLSLTGGGEKANFRISGGYNHETGTIIKQVLNQLTTRVNLDYFVSDRIKVVTNFSLSYTDNQKNYVYDKTDLLGYAYKKMPNLSVYERDGQGNYTDTYYTMLSSRSEQLKDQYAYPNIVALANQAQNHDTNYNIVPEFQLVYNLMGLDDTSTQLKYEGKILFNIDNAYNETYLPQSMIPGADWHNSSSNRSSSYSSKSLGWTTTHTLTFQPHFKNEDHFLMMMLRGQMNSGTSSSQSSAISGTPSGNLQSTSVPGIVRTFASGSSQWRSIYFTYSAHYAYKGRYMADFSVRRDGSTRFGPDKRWGNFPALSFRWNIVDEPFMKNVKWLSMLSVRPGWGRVGRAPDGDYLYLSKYTAGAAYPNYSAGVNSSIVPANIRLAGLKWEDKTTYNLGFDFGFFDDKITGDVNIYTQKTTDLLMKDRALPSSSGYASLAWQNVGSMRNNGWELNINANRIIKKGKKFSMDFNVTFANNKNEILTMEETVLASLNGEFNRSNGSYLTRIQLNNPFGAIYGFRSKGVYQYSEYSANEVAGVSGPNAPVVRDVNGEVVLDENGRTKPMVFDYANANYEFKGGDAIYEDINHDGNINELDIVYLGSSLPKMTGGFGFKVRYGKFTWNNQFNFRYGNKIINAARMNAEAMYGNDNQSRAVNWRWRVEGDVTPIPRALYNEGYNWLGSDRFMEDGSFVRLNYSQISYELPDKLVKDWGLRRVYLTANAQNLFCLTKYSGADPEVGYGGYGVVTDYARTPRSRSFTLGLSITF